MDAKDRLRLYLEQRREMGESEFVLDSLPVEDVLRLLGDKNPSSSRGAAERAENSTRAEGAARTAAAPTNATNWRDALAEIGADRPARRPAPTAKPATPRPVTDAEQPVAPATGNEGSTGAPAGDVPAMPGTGLIVGNPTRELLGGPLSAFATLDALAQEVAKCKACSLYKTAINPVPGEGNPTAGFVCVGEAPGQNEDEQGRPFVGRAGDLLTKILDAIHFKREDVFICNVLKHRPPGNRNPAPDEIKACSPFLLRQLELLQPKVILALGTFASQTLLQTTQPIGKLRGLVHRYHGIPLIVTYHPAALLRNPAWKRPTWEDVQLARRIFDNASQA